MYVATDRSFAQPAANRETVYPPDVERLFRREREIATIVYDAGLATAKDVAARITSPLSNAAIRSMLNRLVRKGVLTRQQFGSRHAFVYGPAVTPSSARQAALEQFAIDFYGGSLSALADAIAGLLAGERLPARQIRPGRRKSAIDQTRPRAPKSNRTSAASIPSFSH